MKHLTILHFKALYYCIYVTYDRTHKSPPWRTYQVCSNFQSKTSSICGSVYLAIELQTEKYGYQTCNQSNLFELINSFTPNQTLRSSPNLFLISTKLFATLARLLDHVQSLCTHMLQTVHGFAMSTHAIIIHLIKNPRLRPWVSFIKIIVKKYPISHHEWKNFFLVDLYDGLNT